MPRIPKSFRGFMPKSLRECAVNTLMMYTTQIVPIKHAGSNKFVASRNGSNPFVTNSPSEEHLLFHVEDIVCILITHTKIKILELLVYEYIDGLYSILSRTQYITVALVLLYYSII